VLDHLPTQGLGERADVPLDRDVDVGALAAEQQVPDGAADQICRHARRGAPNQVDPGQGFEALRESGCVDFGGFGHLRHFSYHVPLAQWRLAVSGGGRNSRACKRFTETITAIADLWKKTAAAANGLWQNHRAATLVGAAAAAIAIAGVAGYLILKRPGDVSNEDAFFAADEQKGVVGVADWPTYGFDGERTRYLAAEDLKPPYKIAWRVNGRKLLEYSPIVVKGSIYAINNNGEAFSAKTRNGKIRWRREVASLNASSPAYSDGMVYLANLEPGQVLGLNAKNGVERWKRELPGRTESSPVVVGDKVIVGCECGTLFAFDKKTGKTIWEADLPGQIKAAPAVSDGVAYVGDYSGTISAVRVSDGSIKWQSGSQGASFGRAGAFYGTAAVAFGRVYAGSKDGRMYSFEQESGDLAWSQTAGGELYAGVVAADTPDTDPTVYFGSFGGSRFYALDARSGDERWSVDAGGPIIGAASLVGEVVYFADLESTSTTALSAADGHEVWTFSDGAYNPVVSDGRRIYLTGYKRIYSLKPGQPKQGGGAKAKAKGADKKD
jgi:outer membrane protein assembly factor BamB